MWKIMLDNCAFEWGGFNRATLPVVWDLEFCGLVKNKEVDAIWVIFGPRKWLFEKFAFYRKNSHK